MLTKTKPSGLLEKLKMPSKTFLIILAGLLTKGGVFRGFFVRGTGRSRFLLRSKQHSEKPQTCAPLNNIFLNNEYYDIPNICNYQ